jgi:hypothetical protein
MSNYGIVEYFGSNESSYPCGYCKGVKDQNTDYGKSQFGKSSNIQFICN